MFAPIRDGDWGLVGVLAAVYGFVLSMLVSMLAAMDIIPGLIAINPLIYIFPLSIVLAYLTVSLND